MVIPTATINTVRLLVKKTISLIQIKQLQFLLSYRSAPFPYTGSGTMGGRSVPRLVVPVPPFWYERRWVLGPYSLESSTAFGTQPAVGTSAQYAVQLCAGTAACVIKDGGSCSME